MAKSPTRRSRAQAPLRRRVASRAPKRTFLVFCEGRRTEPDYLKALKREPAVRDLASVDIRIHEDTLGSAPLTLVKAAADARARYGQDQSEIDEVWCLFDVEWPKNHPNLKEAIALAKRSNVKVAVSNPCFELWLLLHFQDQNAWLDTNAAKRLLRRHDDGYDKGLNGASCMLLRAEAARRARSLEGRHRDNGTSFPNNNPSSGMHRFLEAVERPETNSK